MPITNGVYANVAGASNAQAGQTIQSAVWNNIHIDYSQAINDLLGQMINTSAFRNAMWMNGGFEIWQRGAGSSASISISASTTAYTADRWYITTDVNEASTVSAQAGLADSSNLCARVQRNAAQTGTVQMRFGFPLTTDEVIKLRGKKVSLSVLMRAGATFSPASGTITIEFAVGTGAAGKRSTFSSVTTVISSTVNLTTSTVLGQITSSSIVPITATQGEVTIYWTPVGTAGATDYFEIDNCQLEVDSITDFSVTNYEHIPFSVQLEGCKRHYQKTFSYDVAPAAGGGLADSLKVFTQAAENFGYLWIFTPEMRATPSLTKLHPITATGSNWYNVFTSVTSSATFLALTTADTDKSTMIIASVSAASTGTIFAIHAIASAGL